MTYNTLSQNTEIKLINRLVPFLTNKAFVDIGAEKGIFAQTMLERGMNGVLFDSMTKHLSALQKLGNRYEGNTRHTCTESIKQFFNVITDADDQELDCCLSLQKAGM